MIVVDASAAIALIGANNPPSQLLNIFSDEELTAPHLLDVEVLSALRGLVRGSELSEESALAAWQLFEELNINRVPIALLAKRVWELRHQYTCYDATYIALAEGLDAPLVTCDRKLDAGGHKAHVILIGDKPRP